MLGKGIIASFIALVIDVYLSAAGINPLNWLEPVAAWANGILLIGPMLVFPVLNFMFIWIIVVVVAAIIAKAFG